MKTRNLVCSTFTNQNLKTITNRAGASGTGQQGAVGPEGMTGYTGQGAEGVYVPTGLKDNPHFTSPTGFESSEAELHSHKCVSIGMFIMGAIGTLLYFIQKS